MTEGRQRLLPAFIDRINPAVAFVRGLDQAWFLCSEVAYALGTSPSTLRRMARADPREMGPAEVIAFGRIEIWLYDMAGVDRLHHHLMTDRSDGTPPRGRPRLWTDQERRHRRTALSAASYQRRRARALRAIGDITRATTAENAAAGITTRLQAESDRRICPVVDRGGEAPSVGLGR